MDFPTKWSINDEKMRQNFCEWGLFEIIHIQGMHYDTLKMSKALPFDESSYQAIFFVQITSPMYIQVGKSQKVIPITALCFYGPLSMLVDLAQFGPFCRLFLHLFGALKGLNGPKSGTMGQCISILYWYGAFGGQFGPFQSDFRAQSKRLGPVQSLFLTCLATPNDLNDPKCGTVGQGITILYWGGLMGNFGAFWGHFSPFWSDFGHPSKRLGHILSIFLTHLAFKNDLHAQKYCTIGQGITILYWWGPLGAILGHFRVILGPRARSWGLFGAYFSTVWLPK